jgi:HSP20 family molecular chaperone IbpA
VLNIREEDVMKPQRAFQQKQPDPPATLLSRRNPEDLRAEMQQVELAIARRAHELFEARGYEHGHDWEDWFQAESEVLRPVSITMSESEDRITVRANVLGFEANELKVSVEPRRITILGEKAKAMSAMKSEGSQPSAWFTGQILQVIDLTTDVAAENAVIEWQGGLLKVELPKADRPKAQTAATAA